MCGIIVFLQMVLTTLISSPLEAAPVLVLKLPHSGSSWFTSLLDNKEGVYLTEEIFLTERYMKREHISMYNIAEKSLSYLTESFHYPMGRYPAGRHPTNITNWRVLGATLNPV